MWGGIVCAPPVRHQINPYPSGLTPLPLCLTPQHTGNNGVGQLVYETLRDTRGVEVDGCGTCWQQCDVAHARTPESWWYTPIKNKQKLRSRCVLMWLVFCVYILRYIYFLI